MRADDILASENNSKLGSRKKSAVKRKFCHILSDNPSQNIRRKQNGLEQRNSFLKSFKFDLLKPISILINRI